MNDAEIKRFLQNVGPTTPIWQQFKNPDNQSKLYRDTNGQLVGLLVFSVNNFHPHALGITGYVRDPQLFSQFLADATQEANRRQKDRLVTWGYPPLSAFTDWLMTQGFTTWRQTVEPTVDLAAITLPDTPVEGILTLTEVLAKPTVKQQLITQSLANYRRVHQVNPMAETTPEEWARIIFPGVLADAPLVLMRQQKIIAYTFAFEDTPGTMTLAWLGADDAADLWRLQAVQIDWARRRGMRQLAGEFDSTDGLAWATARRWPFELAPVYTMIGKRL